MFLKFLKLSNFRNLPDIEIDFNIQLDGKVKAKDPNTRKWTLLLGENGTGKSNILKAIALITAGSDALGELIGDINSWIRYGEKDCFIEAQLETADGKERKLRLEMQKDDNLKTLMSRCYETLNEIDAALKNSERNYFVLGYGANRKLANTSRSAGISDFYRSNRANSIATLFHREATMNSLEDWAINLDYNHQEEGLEIVRQAMNRFLLHVEFDHIDKKRRKMIFKTPDGLIPLDQLSDGFQNMAGWMGDLLFRISTTFENYKDPLIARGLVLIDELELHLHPNWQKQLISFVNELLPNFQVVCTTHSPLTAQQAGEGELFILARNAENRISIQAFEGNPRLIPVNELLLTKVFDLDTDESVYLEQKKESYRGLKKKKKLSAKDKKKLEGLKEELLERPLTFQSDLDKKQFELLEQLRKKK